MKSMIELLQEVRGVIESGWTQKAVARNKYGTQLHYYDIAAGQGTHFCLFGAAVQVAILQHENVEYDICRALSKVVGESIVDWNDKFGRTKDEVLCIIDDAIKLESEL